MNLNKKEIEYLEKVKKGEEKYEYKILSENQDDFSFKKLCSEELPLREEIGSVTRGGYSQIRGKGIGIGLALIEKMVATYEE
jgi:glycine cleavage system aminomethyltransferase T